MTEVGEVLQEISMLLGDMARRLVALEREVHRGGSQAMPFVLALGQLGVVSVAHDSLVEVPWDVVEDRHGMVNGVDVVAPRSGVYLVTAWLRWQVNGTGLRRVALRRYVLGVFSETVAACTVGSDGGREVDTSVAQVVRLNAGDAIRVGALQTSGLTLDVLKGRVAVMLLYA